MSRGYPVRYAPQVARAVAVATPLGQGSLSGLSLPAALRILPRVPPPHPALFLAAGAGIAIGYALQYRNGSQPAPLGPPLVSRAGGQRVNPAFTFVEQRFHPTWFPDSHILIAKNEAVGLRHEKASSYTGTEVFWKPAEYYTTGAYPSNTWQKVEPLNDVSPVPANWYFGMSTELRRWRAGQPWYYNSVSIYRNTTASSLPAITTSPAVVVPVPEVPPISTPVLEIPGTLRLPYRHRLIGWRGITIPVVINPVVPTTISVTPTAPVLPGRELKLGATAQTMKLIANTVGQIGEAQDFTRCLMFATGNVYTTRTGRTKAIPKWRWKEALFGLAGLNGPHRTGRVRYTRYINGAFVRADGRVMSNTEVGHRLASCLIQNWWEDATIAKQSQIIRWAQNYVGLTAGPLGAQAIYGIFNGEVPYEGLLDLNL